MIRPYRWISIAFCVSLLGIAAHATASPVIYTLQTVADGKLGNQVFAEAIVTIVMKSDTKYVETKSSSNGGTLFTNKIGSVEVNVTQNGRTTVAHIPEGVIWVYYDTGAGIAGFASSISPSYPVSLNCGNIVPPGNVEYTRDCLANASSGPGLVGTLLALNDPAIKPSLQTKQLPQSLRASTLLTGGSHACATKYTDDNGGLLVCGGPASRGLSTDRGDLYLMDQVGGTNNTWVGEWNYLEAGWTQGNVGFLRVDVLGE